MAQETTGSEASESSLSSRSNRSPARSRRPTARAMSAPRNWSTACPYMVWGGRVIPVPLV